MKRLIPILLLLVSGVAHAETPITGGFGLTLGAKFETNELFVPWEQPESEVVLIFKFEPETPSHIFTEFSVVTTPITRLICVIDATVYGPCKEQFDALAPVLVEKYGMPGKYDSGKPATWAKWHREGSSNTMMLRCSDNELSVSYENLDICALGPGEVEAAAKANAKAKAEAEADNL